MAGRWRVASTAEGSTRGLLRLCLAALLLSCGISDGPYTSPPELVFTPESLQVGQVLVDRGSVRAVIFVRNYGMRGTVLTAIDVRAVPPGYLYLDQPSDPPVALPLDRTWWIEVVFIPEQPGPFEVTVTFWTEGEIVKVIPIRGEAIEGPPLPREGSGDRDGSGH